MTKKSPTPTFVGPAAAEQAAVWSLPQRLVSAWANNDADAFAALFHDDGTMILPGLYKKGRESIREHMAHAFNTHYKGTRVTGQPIHIKFLSRDVMVMITLGGVLGPKETTVSDVRSIRATWLASKQDGQWLLAAYQNSPAVPADFESAVTRK